MFYCRPHFGFTKPNRQLRKSVPVNLDETKVIVFRKGGYLTAREQWVYSGNEIEVVNSYKC